MWYISWEQGSLLKGPGEGKQSMHVCLTAIGWCLKGPCSCVGPVELAPVRGVISATP